MVKRVLISSAVLWLGLTGGAYIRRGTVSTVEGPEATGLVTRTSGFILTHGRASEESPQSSARISTIKSAVETISFPVRLILDGAKEFALATKPHGIKVISLPELQEKIFDTKVRLDGKSARVFHLSGPDENGRIVYTAEDLGNPLETFFGHFGDDKLYLGLTDLQWEKHEVVFARPTKSFHDSFGMQKTLALAPKGGHVAFVRQDLVRHEGNIPDNTYTVWTHTLEIWDALNKRKAAEFPVSEGGGFSWFSDGERIAYGKDVGHNEIPGVILHRVSATFIYDLSNNSHTFFHAGWLPIVSFDDRVILLKDDNNNRYLVDAVTKDARPIETWPVIQSIIASMAPDVVLCKGLPTAGSDVKWTTVYSPFVRTRPMSSIKLVDLSTGEFQTIIKSFEPRSYLPEGQISYGRVKKS